MKDIKKLNEDFKDVFRRGVEKVVPKVGKTSYNPAGEGNFGGGFFMSNAPKEDLEKLHFIGYVKFLQDEMNKGHSLVGRVGRVTDDDLKRYDDYKAWYDEYMADMEEDGDFEDEDFEDDDTYTESIEALNKKFDQVLNEISDNLADRVTRKRIDRRAKAFAKDIDKNTASTNKKAKEAERKHERNLDLNSRRNARHGVVNTESGRISLDKYYSLDKNKRPKLGAGIDYYRKQLDKEFDKLENKED